MAFANLSLQWFSCASAKLKALNLGEEEKYTVIKNGRVNINIEFSLPESICAKCKSLNYFNRHQVRGHYKYIAEEGIWRLEIDNE